MSRKQMQNKGGSREGPPQKIGAVGLVLFVLGIMAMVLVAILFLVMALGRRPAAVEESASQSVVSQALVAAHGGKGPAGLGFCPVGPARHTTFSG